MLKSEEKQLVLKPFISLRRGDEPSESKKRETERTGQRREAAREVVERLVERVKRI